MGDRAKFATLLNDLVKHSALPYYLSGCNYSNVGCCIPVQTAAMPVAVSAASGPTDEVDALISASILRLKGIHAQQAGSCQQQLIYCEKALSELSKAVKSQKAGLQDLTQHLAYALQLDMAECRALMVRPLFQCLSAAIYV